MSQILSQDLDIDFDSIDEKEDLIDEKIQNNETIINGYNSSSYPLYIDANYIITEEDIYMFKQNLEEINNMNFNFIDVSDLDIKTSDIKTSDYNSEDSIFQNSRGINNLNQSIEKINSIINNIDNFTMIM